MTKAELSRLYSEAAEEYLAAAEIDLLDQGASSEHVADKLAALRRLFAAHRDKEVAAAAAWLDGTDDTLH